MKRLTMFSLCAAAVLATAQLSAMNLNLACPYTDIPSPPMNGNLAFSSPDLPCGNDTMMFNHGSTITFRVQAQLRGLDMKWSVHRFAINKPFLQGTAEPRPGNVYYITIPTRNLIPGFYMLKTELNTGVPAKKGRGVEARPANGVCGFGWRIADMALTNTYPSDFKAFWDKARAEMKAIPFNEKNETKPVVYNNAQINEYNLKEACLPADFDPRGHRVDKVESWKISIAGPDGGRIYGWLAKPLGKGPFPAMLILPGAGFNARPRPLDQARHGYLAIDIQIHGQDVDLKKYPKLPGYSDKDMVCSPANKFYYYNIHKRVYQMIEYLASRPDVDKTKIVLVGGSQGGRLGIVGAGMNPRVAAVVTCIANSPNEPYLAWRNSCNSKKVDGMDLTGAPAPADTPFSKCFVYFDPMNFARDIQCPILFNAGTIDFISPPYSTWGSYLVIGDNVKGSWIDELRGRKNIKKEFVWLPGNGHCWSAAFDRYAYRWLDARLGLK